MRIYFHRVQDDESIDVILVYGANKVRTCRISKGEIASSDGQEMLYRIEDILGELQDQAAADRAPNHPLYPELW